MPRVLVFGTFDRLHPGHLYLLGEAAKRGSLTVVIARSSSVEHIKGRPPVQSEEERRSAVAAALPEAQVVLGDSNDYMAPIRAHAPDLIVLGYDQQLPPDIQMEDLPCPVERLDAFEPERYKSSLM